MKNIINFLKEKSYFLLAGTVLIIIIIIGLSSCSKKASSYEKIEENMINAAKNYYSKNKNKLPKINNNSVLVNVSTLIENKLLDEIIDPSNKEKSCSGHVEVTKINENYVYTPFLICEGSYEPKYLSDMIKEVEKDEYGNGVYKDGNSYVYKGEPVNNYVSFNNQLWRIIKLDSDNSVKLVLDKKSDDYYEWDTSYNSIEQNDRGNTSNYLLTNIRKVLKNYYEFNFTDDSKSKIVSKDLCVGSVSLEEEYNKEKECLKKMENEYVGLVNLSDYNASLDSLCKAPNSPECVNRNYMIYFLNTWTLNSLEGTTEKQIYISSGVGALYADSSKSINPVIYLTSKAIVASGNGSYDTPYLIK